MFTGKQVAKDRCTNIVKAMELSTTIKVLLAICALGNFGFLMLAEPYSNVSALVGMVSYFSAFFHTYAFCLFPAIIESFRFKRAVKRGSTVSDIMAYSVAMYVVGRKSKQDRRVLWMQIQILLGGSKTWPTNINWFSYGMLLLPPIILWDYVGIIVTSVAFFYIAHTSAYIHRQYPEDVSEWREESDSALNAIAQERETAE